MLFPRGCPCFGSQEFSDASATCASFLGVMILFSFPFDPVSRYASGSAYDVLSDKALRDSWFFLFRICVLVRHPNSKTLFTLPYSKVKKKYVPWNRSIFTKKKKITNLENQELDLICRRYCSPHFLYDPMKSFLYNQLYLCDGKVFLTIHHQTPKQLMFKACVLGRWQSQVLF